MDLINCAEERSVRWTRLTRHPDQSAPPCPLPTPKLPRQFSLVATQILNTVGMAVHCIYPVYGHWFSVWPVKNLTELVEGWLEQGTCFVATAHPPLLSNYNRPAPSPWLQNCAKTKLRTTHKFVTADMLSVDVLRVTIQFLRPRPPQGQMTTCPHPSAFTS